MMRRMLFCAVFLVTLFWPQPVFADDSSDRPLFWVTSSGVNIRTCASVTCNVVMDATRPEFESTIPAGGKDRVLEVVEAVDEAGCVEDDKCQWYRVRRGYIYAPYTTVLADPLPLKDYECPEAICIVVDLRMQSVHVVKNGRDVFRTWVSTGLWDRTPVGIFRVGWKLRDRHMVGSDYNLPGVKDVTYFTSKGHAFHSTYWHSNFGTPQSHGCINMTRGDASVVYNYAPVGTLIVVGHEFAHQEPPKVSRMAR